IFGVPIGTVTCYAIAAVLDVIAVVRYTHVRPHIKETLLRPLAASAVMLLFLWASKFAFGDSMIGGGRAKILTLVFILLAALVYFVGLVVFSVFDETDISFMPGGGKLKKILKKAGVDVRPTE
ncbi:MAG: polysaccharide biosynthesis C-terminal domain-containing protein, partial [Clostridia bacterium]|nr:polysaccharide biosynthesis C-terminal domain-containing protein [Clostridia bacterium]